MKSVILFSILTILSSGGSNAFANPSCLQSVTNNELLREVSRRMGSSSPGEGRITVFATCNFSDIRIEVTNIQTGVTQIDQGKTGTPRECDLIAAMVNRKANKLSFGGQVAYCNFSDLYTVTILSNGDVRKTSRKTSTPSECDRYAEQINQ